MSFALCFTIKSHPNTPRLLAKDRQTDKARDREKEQLSERACVCVCECVVMFFIRVNVMCHYCFDLFSIWSEMHTVGLVNGLNKSDVCVCVYLIWRSSECWIRLTISRGIHFLISYTIAFAEES